MLLIVIRDFCAALLYRSRVVGTTKHSASLLYLSHFFIYEFNLYINNLRLNKMVSSILKWRGTILAREFLIISWRFKMRKVYLGTF